MSGWNLETDSEVVPDSYAGPGFSRRRFAECAASPVPYQSEAVTEPATFPSLPPYAPPPTPGKILWSADKRIKFADDAIFYQDEHCTVIYDVYPKGRYHVLVIPKVPLDHPAALSDQDIPTLLYLAAVARWIAEGLKKRHGAELRWGVHAVPSMVPLHLHVVSQDFDSSWMKTKKHWNSFSTEFFVEVGVLEGMITEGRVAERLAALEQKLKSPLHCHRCHRQIRDMPTLKAHIKTCTPTAQKRAAVSVADKPRPKKLKDQADAPGPCLRLASVSDVKPEQYEQGAAACSMGEESLTPPPRSYVLVPKQPEVHPRIELNSRGCLRLGRTVDKCDCVIASSIISGMHLKLVWDATQSHWQAIDCSSNGSFLNGTKLTKNLPHVLTPHDVLCLGNPKAPESVSYEFIQTNNAVTQQLLHPAEQPGVPLLRRRSSLESGGSVVTRLSSEKSCVRIGRSQDKCDLVVTSSVVSGLHLELIRVGELKWKVIDHSSNGTFINGQRMQKGTPRVLVHNDALSLGPPQEQQCVRFDFCLPP